MASNYYKIRVRKKRRKNKKRFAFHSFSSIFVCVVRPYLQKLWLHFLIFVLCSHIATLIFLLLPILDPNLCICLLRSVVAVFRHRTAARFARIFVCHLILTINPLGYTLYSTPIHCCCMYFHKAIFRTNSPTLFHLFFSRRRRFFFLLSHPFT